MNLTELQQKLNSHIQEKYEAPDEGGAEWNWYRDLLNVAQTEWERTYLWSSLYREVNTFFGGATLSLPTDFNKFNGPLRVAADGTTYEYLKINPDERSQYLDSERYCYILGDKGNGFSMVVNPGTLVSTNSVYYSYYKSANSLISGSDVTECPDPNYLVEKAVSAYWRARDDNRFTTAEANANVLLARMLEFEQSEGRPTDLRVKTYEETHTTFRIGRD